MTDMDDKNMTRADVTYPMNPFRWDETNSYIMQVGPRLIVEYKWPVIHAESALAYARRMQDRHGERSVSFMLQHDQDDNRDECSLEMRVETGYVPDETADSMLRRVFAED